MSNSTNIGKYQILATLGKGAHSTILHIRRNLDSREYALKIVNIDGKDEIKFLEQAKHEYRVAQMLGHPNLIKVFAIEFTKNWLFQIKKVELLIEYVNGQTIDTVPLAFDKLIPIFIQVASGIAQMHRRGVFHGDLKPINILYKKQGQVKIIDFGLATIKGEPKERVQGTPEYMAPETMKHKIVDERTDIYNFGATMYRLVTMRLPPNSIAITESVKLNSRSFKSMMTPVQELNKAVPKSLCDLIHKCLEYDPNKRPEKMSEVLDNLRDIANELNIPIPDELE